MGREELGTWRSSGNGSQQCDRDIVRCCALVVSMLQARLEENHCELAIKLKMINVETVETYSENQHHSISGLPRCLVGPAPRSSPKDI